MAAGGAFCSAVWAGHLHRCVSCSAGGTCMHACTRCLVLDAALSAHFRQYVSAPPFSAYTNTPSLPCLCRQTPTHRPARRWPDPVSHCSGGSVFSGRARLHHPHPAHAAAHGRWGPRKLWAVCGTRGHVCAAQAGVQRSLAGKDGRQLVVAVRVWRQAVTRRHFDCYLEGYKSMHAMQEPAECHM